MPPPATKNSARKQAGKIPEINDLSTQRFVCCSSIIQALKRNKCLLHNMSKCSGFCDLTHYGSAVEEVCQGTTPKCRRETALVSGCGASTL